MRILAENTSCIVIDYQEKILPAMSGREELVANSATLLKGLKLLEIPMVLTTQYAKGLGNNIPEICEAGIDSLKIEGRMKTALYVATVARTYRKALDDYYESEEKYRANMEWYKAEIGKCTYRQFTTGFFFGKPTNETQIYDSNTYVNEYIYLGIIEEVRQDGLVRIEQRNKFCVGDTIEIMKPNGDNVLVTVDGMYDADMNPVESCPHSKQLIYLKLSQTPDQYDLLRVHNVK